MFMYSEGEEPWLLLNGGHTKVRLQAGTQGRTWGRRSVEMKSDTACPTVYAVKMVVKILGLPESCLQFPAARYH